MITEQLLRNCIKEAQEKGQTGIYVWANWQFRDMLDSEMRSGNRVYEQMISQIENQKIAILDATIAGFCAVGVVAASVKELNSSNKYFKKYLKECQKRQMQGPVVFFPSQETSKYC